MPAGAGGEDRSGGGRALDRAARGLPCTGCAGRGRGGSTLRFLLPVLGALGVRAQIRMHGRLPERPLSPLWGAAGGARMQLRREDDLLHVCGQLQAGSYALPGNVSSQFVSGLLFALPLLAEDSVLTVTGQLQSARYVAMTEQALRAAGIRFEKRPVLDDPRRAAVCRARPAAGRGRLVERGVFPVHGRAVAAGRLRVRLDPASCRPTGPSRRS